MTQILKSSVTMDMFIKNKSTPATRAYSVRICVAVRMIGSVHAVLFDSSYCSEIRHQHGLQYVLTQRAPGAQRQFPHCGSRATYPTVGFSPCCLSDPIGSHSLWWGTEKSQGQRLGRNDNVELWKRKIKIREADVDSQAMAEKWPRSRDTSTNCEAQCLPNCSQLCSAYQTR